MPKTHDIRVLLIRTGETEWEREGRFVGHTDVPLSEGGRRASAEIARDLQNGGSGGDGSGGAVRIATVYCGPDEASIATASEIAAATGARVKSVECLGEMNFGLWEGLRQKDLEEKCPRAFRQWMDDPTMVQVPEGETVEEAQERILTGLAKTLDRARTDHGAIAVVLRPVAMALVACAINGVPTRNIWSMMKDGLAPQWQTIQRGVLRRAGTTGHAGVAQ